MMAPEARALTQAEFENDREPLRVYPFHCGCGCPFFTVDWAMYSDLQGRPRIFCAECKREVVPTEPMEFNA